MMLKKSLGVADFSKHLSKFEHVTSSFIYRQLFYLRHKRNPIPNEIEVDQRALLELLKYALRVKPACVQAIPGAAQLLALLQSSPEWQVAIASGGWKAPGYLKLAHAGLKLDEIPAAFADDALSRERIVDHARERSLAQLGIISFERVVCVGASPWNLQTARNLGHGFIGITCDGDAAELRRHGARRLLRDFTDAQAFIAALEEEAALVTE